MSKFLVVGDVHLSRKRAHRSKTLLEKIAYHARSRPDISGIILLGDVFDTHDIQDNDCLTMYSKFILENEKELEIHHILGNHEMNDSKSLLPSVHALNPWHGRKNVFVHDKPSLRNIDGTWVVFAPYAPNGLFEKMLIQSLGEDYNQVNLVFAHQEFIGCTMGASQASTTGDEIPQFSVISGHIHGAQQIGRVWYPGTPCQHNFAESEEKFVYVLDIRDGSYTIDEKIDLQIPKFKTIRTDALTFPEIPLEDGNEYRVVVRDIPENIVLYKKTEFYKHMHQSVKFKFEVIKQKAERIENEKHLSFEERLEELVEEEGLRKTYEIIFKKFPESSQS